MLSCPFICISFWILHFWILNKFWVSEFLNFKFQFSLNCIWFGAWEQIKLTDWTAFSMMSLNPKIFEVFLLDIAMINQNIRYFNFHFNYKKFYKTFYFPSQHCWSAVSDIFYQVLFWIFQKHFQKLLNNLKIKWLCTFIHNNTVKNIDLFSFQAHLDIMKDFQFFLWLCGNKDTHFQENSFFLGILRFQLFLCTLW